MSRVHTIGDDSDVFTMKILAEQGGGTRGDGGKRNFRVRVNQPLQSSQKRAVGAPMKSPKKTGPSCIEVFFVRRFLEAMEQGVNDDNIGIQTVDSRGKNDVELKPFGPALARVLSDPIYRESLAERSRKAQQDYFSWQAIAQQYVSALQGPAAALRKPV
jgi:hypothetical protein